MATTTKLTNIKQSTNRYNQKSVYADMITSKDEVLLNTNNYGVSPLDVSWDKDEHIILVRGSKVSYQMQETHQGDVHTITFTNPKNNKLYSLSRTTNKQLKD